jgi:integrase/recombinase XerC
VKKQPGFKAGLKKVETKGGYVYYYKVKINGVVHHGSTGESDKEAAEDYLRAVKKNARGKAKGLITPIGFSMTYAELAKYYYESNEDKSKGYKSRYLHGLKHWLNPIIGNIPIGKLELRDLSKVKANYMSTPSPYGKPHNEGGLRTILIDLRTTLNFAVAQELIAKLPFKVKGLKIQEKPVQAIVAADADKFLQAVDSISNRIQVRLGIRIMLFMGLRISELTGMRWEWFRAGYTEYTPGLTKGKEAQGLPIPPFLTEMLIEYREETRRHWAIAGRPIPGWVFWDANGNHRANSFVQSTIQNAAKAIGLEGSWTPHRLRASCATILAEMGGSAHSIQIILRHKQLKTTLHYVRVEHDQMRNTQARMLPLFQNPKPIQAGRLIEKKGSGDAGIPPIDTELRPVADDANEPEPGNSVN